ncbi:MAG TPA: ATP-binding cassette domain-containing protein [Burkholderiaceae bacterium]
MIEFDFQAQLFGADGPMAFDASGQLQLGEFTALFGPSGAGKTTLLRLLAGLSKPRAGRLLVDGAVWFDSARGIDLPPQRRSIGFVFQDHALFPNMTVQENAAYALSKGDTAWLGELLDACGLTALRDRLPDTLSGGQKQRVALARALARKPRLLLLDEPLSALDLRLRLQLQDELLNLHRRFGLTTLMVSHDLGEVFKLAHKVLRIEHGKLVQAGTPAALFLRKEMAGRLKLQAQVLEIRREDVVYTLSLLVGSDIVDVMASPEEAKALRVGETISLAAKSFNPLLFRQD